MTVVFAGTICGLPGGGRYILASGGMGGYGDPPNHPNNLWHIEEWRGSRSLEAEGHFSIEYAMTCSWMPDPVKAKCRALMRTYEARRSHADSDG